MKFLFKIAILFCCIFVAQADVHCYSDRCERMLKNSHKPRKENLSANLATSLSSIDSSAVYAVANNSTVIYAATAAGNVWSHTLLGTWTQVGSQVDTQFIDTISFDNSNNIYAGSANGRVFRFNGTSWVVLSGDGGDDTLDGSCVDSIINVGGVMHAATDGGNVWKYENNSWIKLPGNNLDVPGTLDASSVGSIAKDSSNNIYASTYNGNIWKYSSESWAQLSGSGSGGSLDTYPIWIVAVDSSNNQHAGTFLGNVFRRSTSSWSQLSGSGSGGSLDESIVWSMVFDGLARPYAATLNGNVWRRSIFGSWSKLAGDEPDDTLDGSIVWSLTTDLLSVYAGTDNGNVWSFNILLGGWTQVE
jgi:hypothetical protein